MLVYWSQMCDAASNAFMQRSMHDSFLHSFGNSAETYLVCIKFAAGLLACQKLRVLDGQKCVWCAGVDQVLPREVWNRSCRFHGVSAPLAARCRYAESCVWSKNICPFLKGYDQKGWMPYHFPSSLLPPTAQPCIHLSKCLLTNVPFFPPTPPPRLSSSC